MDASPIQPPSPSLPTNLSDQTIGNKGDNDVSILLGNGDGSFTSTTSDVVVGDAPSSVQYNSLTQILVLIWLYKKFFLNLSCGIIYFLFIR